MSKPDSLSPHGLRNAAMCVYIALPESVADELSGQLAWAANEIDRLNAIVQAHDQKTRLIDSNAVQDNRVRTRACELIAWHVDRTHADLSDHDLVQAAFNGYRKHWGRVLIDPNE
jgi:hypothetical protein